MDEDSQLIEKIIANTPYQCQCKLGEGAYGEVYKVLHRTSKQPFALKVIDLPKINKLNKMTEVMIEVNILKRLAHPGLIKLKELLRW
jgi:serine/threonine protein kinase